MGKFKEYRSLTIAGEYGSVIHITSPEFTFMYLSSISLITYAARSIPAPPEGEG